MKKLLTLTALGTLALAAQAQASGFNLREQSVAAMGNAFAGATAGAEDISYSYFNPAGLTRFAGTQVNFGGTYIAPRSKAKSAVGTIPGITGPQITPYTDNIVHAAVAPYAYMSHQLNSRTTAAISMNVPYGMITKYEDQWAGRMHGTLSDVKTMTITPMLAYKATCNLSIGAGVQMQYIKARLRNGVLTPAPGREDDATLKGDAFDVGYSLGALYEVDSKTRFGVGYRSEVAHKLDGDIKFSGLMTPANQDIKARIATPANLTFGAYHDLTDKWAIMGEVGRTYWSSFSKLTIEGDKSGMLSNTEEKWRNTTFYSMGASYQVNDKWKVRAGVAWDQSAVGNRYRTPRIPDSDRIWYSSGVEFKQNEKLTWNVGYTYIKAKNAQVHLGDSPYDARRGRLDAEYQNDIHLFGLGLNYNF